MADLQQTFDGFNDEGETTSKHCSKHVGVVSENFRAEKDVHFLHKISDVRVLNFSSVFPQVTLKAKISAFRQKKVMLFFNEPIKSCFN